jgi:hypothetical protein
MQQRGSEGSLVGVRQVVNKTTFSTNSCTKKNWLLPNLLVVRLVTRFSSLYALIACYYLPSVSHNISAAASPLQATNHLIRSTRSSNSDVKMSGLKCNETPQFLALQSYAEQIKFDEKLHLKNLCSDAARCAGLVATHTSDEGRKIILDYSRQQVTGEIMELLFDLADKVGFVEKRSEMRCGVKINTTEGRSVMHHALRMPKGYDFSLRNPEEGKKILDDVHSVRDKIEAFTRRIRSGEHKGVTGKELKNIIAIGIGGSQLGPEFVSEALRADTKAAEAAEGRKLCFLANVDPVDFSICTSELDPAETLVIVISKTFTTAETMLNARTTKKWLLDGLAAQGVSDADEIVKKHIVAVSTARQKVIEFGIDPANMFEFWDWVSFVLKKKSFQEGSLINCNLTFHELTETISENNNVLNRLVDDSQFAVPSVFCHYLSSTPTRSCQTS